ncbi:biotin transporter BioY [Arthrobacter sp. B1805]|uniref:biotin transporter BioY n=1 Tax=Arthrobacter sp. B1805 TaxID=2058892 RepID=UPI000CE4067E|nr:biotin transporter BioY [Arthrobacter sp. B1805]
MQPAEQTVAGSTDTGRSPARKRWDTTDLSLVAVFAALIAALAILPGIPVGPLGVPITLQTLGVLLAGVVLGPTRGAAAVLLYLAAGLIGLPVFSGFNGGFGVLAGPSAGYLVAFPLAALVAGLLAVVVLRRTRRFRVGLLFLACLAASLLTIHPLGIAGLMVNAGLPLRDAIIVDAAYLPGDVVKDLLAAAVAVSVHRAFPRLLGARARGAQ